MKITGKMLMTGFAATVAGLVLASCGGDDDKATGGKTTSAAASASDQVRQVTRDFTVALAAGFGGTAEQRKAACQALSSAAKAQIQEVGAKLNTVNCEDTVETIGTLASDDQRAKTKTMEITVQVDGDTATASYPAPRDGAPTTLTLVRAGDGWVINSLPTSADSATANSTTVPAP